MALASTDGTAYRFEWGAIIAGVVFSLAISIVLMQFGSIIGLSAASPLRGMGSMAAWGVVATGLWLLWVQLLASLGGGYLAGRLRTAYVGSTPHESELRDGIAGLTVWALSTVLVFTGATLAGAVASYIAAVTPDLAPVVNEVMTREEQNSGIIFAFIAGATALLSAAAAWWAGTAGGDHRDKNTDFSRYLTFRRI